MTFGEALRAARSSASLSLRGVAAAMSARGAPMSKMALHRLESGETTKIDVVAWRALCDVLDIAGPDARKMERLMAGEE